MKVRVIILLFLIVLSLSIFGLSVKVVSPKDGDTVTGKLVIEAQVDDPSGVLQVVEFYLEKYEIYETRKPPFICEIDTDELASGSYKVTVYARGKEENVRATVTFSVAKKNWVKKVLSYNITPRKLLTTSDGGFLILGSYKGASTIVKLKKDLVEEWSKTINKNINEIIPIENNEYIVLGSGVYLAKLDKNGNILWEKVFEEGEEAYGIVSTKDGYIIVGSTSTFDTSGKSYIYVFKVSKDGRMEWEKAFSPLSTSYAQGLAVFMNSDNTFDIVAADKSYKTYNELSNIRLLRIDDKGNRIASSSQGIIGNSYYFGKVTRTSDGGYLMVGESSSYSSSKSGGYVVKLDNSGKKSWEVVYGNEGFSSVKAVVEAPDGGYLLVGQTNIFGTAPDTFILRIDKSGKIMWKKIYGEVGSEIGYDVVALPAGGFMIIGQAKDKIFFLELDHEGKVKVAESIQK